MKLIPKSQLNNNPNTQYGLNKQVQDMLTNGNAQFVIDMALQMKLGHNITSLALHLAIAFFHRKCYVNHDRFIVLTAALLLATKLRDMDSRLKILCSRFDQVIKQQNLMTIGRGMMGNSEMELYTEDKYRRLKDEITIAESELLRTLEYDIDFISPYEYIKKYCDIFFPVNFSSNEREKLSKEDMKNRELNKKLYIGTRVILLDSYRTRASLCYSPLVIFLSCFLIACNYEKCLPHRTQVIRRKREQKVNAQKMQVENSSQRQRQRQDPTINKSQTKQKSKLIQKQGQKPHKLLQTTPLTTDHPCSVVREMVEKPSEQMGDFELYMTMLELISREEGEKVTAKMVKQCTEIINSLLELWRNSNT